MVLPVSKEFLGVFNVVNFIEKRVLGVGKKI